MAKKEGVKQEADLEKALDESLDELQKAAGGEEISKTPESKDLKKAESEDAKGDKDEDDEDEDPEDMKGHKKGYMKGHDKDEDEDEEDEEEEKAMKGGYRKSVEDDLAKSDAVKGSIEVSKFLKEFVKSSAEILGDVKHEMAKLRKSNKAIAKALVKSQAAQNDMLKSFGSDITSFGSRPLPRKSVPVSTIEKAFRGQGEKEGAEGLTKSEISGRLANLEIAQKVPIGTTSRYEMTGELQKSVETLVTGELK